MLENLEQVSQWSEYFRNLLLYQQYAESCTQHEITLRTIEERVSRIGDVDLVEKLQETARLLESSGLMIEKNFSEFDFSPSAVSEAISDYKIAVYIFAKRAVLDSIEEVDDFSSPEDYRDYVSTAFGILKEFLERQCTLIDGAYEALDSATKNVLGEYPRKAVA